MDVIRQALNAWKVGLQARLVAVALFGSRARGEERVGSDWDLFVLAESLPQDPLDRQLYLKSMLPLSLASKVSVLAKTPAEFEKELLSVYLDIAADGVLIFDPHKYLGPRLEQVRQIARNAGLQRRRWKGEWVWKWKDSPRPGWEVNWQ